MSEPMNEPEPWVASEDSVGSPCGLERGLETEIIRACGLFEGTDLEAYGKLRRSTEGRAVPLHGIFSSTGADVALLALGFARGEPSALAVPHARRAAT